MTCADEEIRDLKNSQILCLGLSNIVRNNAALMPTSYRRLMKVVTAVHSLLMNSSDCNHDAIEETLDDEIRHSNPYTVAHHFVTIFLN
mgnify:CR=1 FL=1